MIFNNTRFRFHIRDIKLFFQRMYMILLVLTVLSTDEYCKNV